MTYFDWGIQNIPEKVDFGQRKDSFLPPFDTTKIDFTCIFGVFASKRPFFSNFLKFTVFSYMRLPETDPQRQTIHV